MNGFIALGLFFAAAAGVSIYLASPNQRWRGVNGDDNRKKQTIRPGQSGE